MLAPHQQALAQDIAAGDVVLVIGTGASVQTTANNPVASWTGLLERAVEHARYFAKPQPDATWYAEQARRLVAKTTPDLIAAATAIEAALNAPDGTEFKRFLDESVGTLAATASDLGAAIAALHNAGAAIATTNYDHLLEAATGSPTLAWTTPDRVEDALRRRTPAIIHLHGSFKEPASVVLGDASYQRLRDSTHAQALQQALSLMKTLVFIGCGPDGLTDPNLGRLLEWLRLDTVSGLDRHYLLCRDNKEAEFRRDFAAHPRITVVPYGPEFTDLPRFLRTVTPSNPSPRPLETPPLILGRDEDIATLVNLLSPRIPAEPEGGFSTAIPTPTTPARILIHGPGGIGKTTLAQAVRAHPAIAARYPNRPMARLETIATADAMRAAITQSCNLPTATPFPATLSHFAATPTLLLLDNLETPFDAEQTATESLLAELCAIPNLALLATIRGTRTPRGPAWTRHETKTLSAENARALFLHHAGTTFAADPDLPNFLRALAGHPLAIELIALRATADATLSDLWTEYQTQGPVLAARDGVNPDRLSALIVSIELSLKSPRIGPEGRRLFGLLGALPSGISDSDRRALLGNAARPALDQLRLAGLAERAGDRLDFLPPIRDHARRHHPPQPPDAAAWPAHYLSRLAIEYEKRQAGTFTITPLVPDLPNLDAALQFATAAVDPANVDGLRDLSISHNKLGDIRRTQGDLQSALASFRSALAIAERLASADPANTEGQRDLSISHEKIGDIRRTQGNLPTALASFEAGLAIAERLAAADPANAHAQRDLFVSHSKLGDIRRTQNDLQSALASFQAAFDIAERLAAADPANAQAQRDLSVSHDRIGEMRVTQGDLSAALASFEAGRAIAERLAAADPANAQARRDLSVCHNKIGDIRVTQGDLQAALASFQAGLAIRERLAAADPANAEAQRDLSISHERIGDIRLTQGDLQAALASHQFALSIREHLAATDPGSAEAQRDLSIAHEKIGDIRRTQGNQPAALASFEASLAIAERLAAADPTNALWQHDLALSLQQTAGVHPDPSSARRDLTRARDVLCRLNTVSPTTLAYRDDLAVIDAEIARLTP